MAKNNDGPSMMELRARKIAEQLVPVLRAEEKASPGEPRPGYKRTMLGWIPEEWEVMKLGTMTVKVGSGVTPRGGEKVYRKEGVPFVRSQNVGWGELLLEGIAYVTPQLHAEMDTTELIEHDVLLNVSGASIGRCAMVTNGLAGGNVNQHVCIIRPDHAALDSRYLMHFLLSHAGQQQVESFQAGGNRQGLNYDQIRSFLIPQPPLLEQRRIAAILGTWDEAIGQLQQLITAKQRRTQGLMHELLSGRRRFPGFSGSWKEVLVGDITSFHKQGYYTTDKYDAGGEYILLRGTDMHSPTIDHASSPRIHMPREMYEAFKVEAGDFLVVRSGTIGDYGIVKEEVKAAFASYLIKFQFDPRQVLTDYFGLFYTSRLAKQQLKWITQGSTNVNINAENIKALTIPLPSLAEQQCIVDTLHALDDELDHLEQQLTHLTTQKRGLMQQLLTGRVRTTSNTHTL